MGLSHFAQALVPGPPVDPLVLLHRFLPPHLTGPDDPFGGVERLLAGIIRQRGELSLYAVPAFIWFSTRLFAGIRVSLNDIYDVSVRPSPRRNFLVGWSLGKLRDAGMVVTTVALILANTILSGGLALLQSQSVAPGLTFFVSTMGRLAAEAAALVFSVLLFLIVYKYASVRRLPWRTALLASSFTALLFEVAKRLYGLYLSHFASAALRSEAGNATVGAAILFVLWIYYTAIVFLLGAVVAETWELRKMQRRQRAILE